MNAVYSLFHGALMVPSLTPAETALKAPSVARSMILNPHLSVYSFPVKAIRVTLAISASWQFANIRVCAKACEPHSPRR